MSTPERAMDARPVTESLIETVSIGVSFVLFLYVFIVMTSWSGAPDVVLTSAAHMGKVVLANIDWTLGAYIAALVAFYVVVVGGQILGDAQDAARTRRILGFIGELFAALALVYLVLIACHCSINPTDFPVLLVVVPVVLLVTFLAVQLGAFLVPDRDVRRAEALRVQAEASARLRQLQARSAWGPCLVIAINFVVVDIVAIGVFGLVSGADQAADAAIALTFISALVIVTLSGARYASLASLDRVTRIGGWLGSLTFIVTFGGLLVFLFVLLKDFAETRGVVVAAASIFLLSVTTVHIPVPRKLALVRNLSVAGAVARLAARTLVGRYAKSVRVLQGLKVAVPSRLPFRARLMELFAQ